MKISKEYTSQLEEMKSKFISILIPINDVNEFKERLKEIRKEHRKAKHVVYAYKINGQLKSSDDGEPKGTAGRPILELLMKKDIQDIALIVVRYFGGTKLGSSKLLRTYLKSAIDVINKVDEGI